MKNWFFYALLGAMTLSACSKSEVVDTLDLDHEDVFSLKVGDCFDDDGEEDEVDSIPMRSCDVPHDNEVYAIYKLPTENGFPATAEAEEAIDERCKKEFTAFVSYEYDDSQYDFSTLTPSEATWADGDREVVCFIHGDENVKLNKSLKNAGK